eukprot:GEMP01002381.1.p1 GENE.GEMP01002381.1~~GEMP01002381.1.p1  ORF type:complete len:1402 (+),score=251.75 GEMP01002381.1:70-4275(+)
MVDHLIRVQVYELQNALLAGSSSISPFVRVRVYDEEQETSHHDDSSSCSFNFFFAFIKRLTPVDLTNGVIVIEVLARHAFGNPTLLGRITFAVAKVFYTPRHYFPKAWLPVSLPENPTGFHGALRVSCGVFLDHHEMPGTVMDVAWLDNTWSSRLAMCPSFDNYRWAMLNFCVLKADHLSSSMQSDSIRPFIRVKFNTMTLQTKVKGKSATPSWNEELKFPLSHPCRCEQILVELHSEGFGDVPLAWTAFQLTPILNGDLATTWVELFSTNEKLEQAIYSSDDSRSWCYLGRLLVAASIQRQKQPLAGSFTLSQHLVDPQMQTFELWVDIFETCFDLPENPIAAAIRIEVGNTTLEIAYVLPTEAGLFLWGKEGRGEQLLHLPVEGGELAALHDLVVFVYYKSEDEEWQPYAFRRVKLRSILGSTPQCIPKWHDSLSFDTGKTEGCFLANLHLVPQAAALTRLPRDKYKLRPHQFRGQLHQAINLPVTGSQGLPNPYVKVSMGSMLIVSTFVSKSLNPSWDDQLICDTYLPSNPALMPNVRISILDYQESEKNNLVLLGKISLPATEFTRSVDWTAFPETFNLKLEPEVLAAATNECSSFIKLLASFEIAPVKAKPQHQLGPNHFVVPLTMPCIIHIFIIGIRSSHPALARITPRVRVSFGRDAHTQEALSQEWTKDGIGSDGNYNFLEEIVFSANLPQNANYQSFVEIEVVNVSEDSSLTLGNTIGNMLWGQTQQAGSSENPKPLAWASVPLNNHISYGKRIKDMCNVSFQTPRPKFSKPGSYFTGNSEDPTREQMTASRGGSLYTVDTADTSRAPTEASDTMTQNTFNSGSLAFSMFNSTSQSKRKVGKKEEYARTERKLDKSFGMTEILSNTNKLNTWKYARNCYFSHEAATPEEKLKQFKPIDSMQACKFVDMKKSVEEEIKQSLPYGTAALIAGKGMHGDSRIPVGILKLACFVEDGSEFPNSTDPTKRDSRHSSTMSMGDSTTLVEREERQMWDDQLRKLRAMYNDADDMIVNVYILSGEHLVPLNASADTDTFIWLKFAGSKLNTSYNIKDDYNLRKASPKPEYNRRYIIEKVRFPEHATLEVSVMEKGSMLLIMEGEQEIGVTRIDLEDRWMSQKYRDMMMRSTSDDQIQVETRLLYRDDYAIARCHLKMWIEVLSFEEQGKCPMETLKSGEAKTYQLQCCVYRVKILDAEENTGMHLYITGTMIDDIGHVMKEQTDTHFGEYHGRGTFNWRFLFNLKIPCQNTSITFQVWDSSVVTGGLADEPYANSLVDLGADFETVRDGEAELPPKGWIEMTNALFGIRAELQISMRIVNEENFTNTPVGRGREEPNVEPFLDPNDPHLMDHRRYLANSAAFVAAYNAFESSTSGRTCCLLSCCCMLISVIGMAVYPFLK